ncbi:ankyrin repeat-containing domain protein [Pestalotiopsis sp. NC0098]|nr:ankyrin repeat-containing domain protein [Pestalotiopsis sp. NC0098]
MSFGFGVGDFLAVAKLANDIRKDYADAPDQFRQITSDVRNLAIALGDVDVSLSARDVGDAQKVNLRDIRESCRSVLEDTSKVLNRYSSLDTKTVSVHGRTRRVWNRMRWEPDDARDLRSRITANIAALNSFTGSNIRDTVYRIEERQIRQEDQKILDWLDPIDVAAQHSDYISQRQAGTGQWLLDSTEYSRWRTTKSDILFCYGIPGAGKTMLSSIVVNDLQDTYGIKTDVAICYLYCNFNRQDEQACESVLLRFLKQLSQAAIYVPDSLRELFDRCQSKRSRPDQKEIMDTFCSIAGLFSRTYIVIDALDELRTSNGCQEQLISCLLELQQNAGVNVLATSRPVPHIMDRFKGFESLEIRASTDDIRRYAKGSIHYLPGFVRRNPELLEEITDGIVKSVDGMFLLAKLHLDALKGKTSPRQLKKTLSNLATGRDAYHEAYVDTMQRIHGQLLDQKELAMNALMWIVYAKRPLKTSELQHALGVELDELEFFEDNLPDLDDIVTACCGLVTVDEESNIIRLIHYTTQEFFDRRGSEIFPNAQAQIANVCLTYLSFDVFNSGHCNSREEFEQRLADYPLFDYASGNWGHFALSGQVDSELIQNLLDRPAHVQACGQALMEADPLGRLRPRTEDEHWSHIPFRTSSLHLAAYFGLTSIMSRILDVLDADIQDSMQRTPVCYAALNGHQAAVGLLLERNCEPSMADSKGWAPVFWATMKGHEAVVRLLLENGAQTDQKDEHECTALCLAAYEGHESVVRLLLDHGAYIETADEYGRSILSMAAITGHQAVVRVLLYRGAKVESMDRFGRTPLYSSLLLRGSGSGRTRVVEMLLEHDAMVNTRCTSWGHTPLMLAAENNHSDVIKLLLTSGADHRMTDICARSAFMYAVERNNLRAVEILLEVDGLEPNAKDHWGSTVISVAARLGFPEVFNKIAALPQVDLHTTDSFGRSALWWAQKQRCYGIARDISERSPPARVAALGSPEIPAMGEPLQFVRTGTLCDVCRFPCPDSPYHCDDCAGGDLDICRECYSLGARCLVQDHDISIKEL